jgi:hypothetical protein
MSRQLFISYSHKDKAFASNIAKDLENEGYDIWLDRTDIQTGSRWDDEIVKGLKTSQVFMVLLSKAAVASENVKDEIGFATDHQKKMVPLLLEPCEIPLRLRRVQYVDFIKLPYKEGLKLILEILHSAFPEVELHPKQKERKLMDPAMLAATITGLIAASLAKIGESALEEIGAKLPGNVGKIWAAIRKRFEGRPAAWGATSDLVKNAKDKDNREAFALQLKKALREDEDFADVLEALVKELHGSINTAGDNNIVVGDFQIGGDLSGNLTIGHNNLIGGDNQEAN